MGERADSNTTGQGAIPRPALLALRDAATDKSHIAGLTHQFYRYPARFSPTFVGAAIEAFSKPEDIILDPYVGGGTTVVEAMARGRRAIGCDLNSLAVFVAKAKCTHLSLAEKELVADWAINALDLSYHDAIGTGAPICPTRTKNLNLPRARPAKKFIAMALRNLQRLESPRARRFARCVLLNVGQWALNNKRVAPTLEEIREKVWATAHEMLLALEDVTYELAANARVYTPVLHHGNARDVASMRPFSKGKKASLVVTSPPYPGIHILYHRWQVDGRRETPAPYWIADCLDGAGFAFYNFGDRRQDADVPYFEESLRTLRAVRSVMKTGALMVQLIAFARPRNQLPKYLRNMELAGFREVREAQDDASTEAFRRIWRPVPQRAWYASLKGSTSSSREVVLIHRAI